MAARFSVFKVWDGIRESYWFAPMLLAIGSLGLAFGMIRLDKSLPNGAKAIPWVYSGGADGARAVLQSIATSMITLAGVTFSITLVALTLASQQFGPRVLHAFMRARAIQIVFGVFVATFLYSLAVLRVTGTEVPQVSVTTGVLLAFVSVGFLIYFIHRVPASILPAQVIDAICGEIREAMDAQFPKEPSLKNRSELSPQDRAVLRRFDAESRPVPLRISGYVQDIDDKKLVKWGGDHDAVVRLECRPGDYVVKGAAVARVRAGRSLTEKSEARLRQAFVLGERRTVGNDMLFTIGHLSQVAVRALSPAVIDPFTACDALDAASDILVRLAERPPAPVFRFEDGRLRIWRSRPVTFADAADMAFDTIRLHARAEPGVLLHMLEAISAATDRIRPSDCREVLSDHAERTFAVLRAGKDDRLVRRGEQLLATHRLRRRRWSARPARVSRSTEERG